MTTDTTLIDALRRGDDHAFREVVIAYHPALVRTARRFVGDRAVAEEVTQETWLAVIRSIGAFEGRSSFRTWLFAILANQARSRFAVEQRSAPSTPAAEPSVRAEWFQRVDDEDPGHWQAAPIDWGSLPDAQLLGRESIAVAQRAIDRLPDTQRQVITLRDIEGFDAPEVSAILGLTEGNERVLLHRARSKVRAALETYFEGAAAS